MRIQIGRWTIQSAKSLKKKILAAKERGPASEIIYWQCVGIYDTRIFGLCFYRNGDYFQFKLKQQ